MSNEALVAVVTGGLSFGVSLIVGGIWVGRLMGRVSSLERVSKRHDQEIADRQTKEVCGFHEQTSTKAIEELKQDMRDGRQEFRRIARNLTKLAGAIQNGVKLDDRS